MRATATPTVREALLYETSRGRPGEVRHLRAEVRGRRGRARARAMDMGLDYVYVGNVPGHEWENTYCPGCGRLLIRRYGFDVPGYIIGREGRCSDCGRRNPIVGEPCLAQPSISIS